MGTYEDKLALESEGMLETIRHPLLRKLSGVCSDCGGNAPPTGRMHLHPGVKMWFVEHWCAECQQVLSFSSPLNRKVMAEVFRLLGRDPPAPFGAD